MLKRITLKQAVYFVVITLLLSSCSHKPSPANKYYGVQITNEPPRGSKFIDSSGKTDAFRSIVVYITNDSLTSLVLQIDVPNKFTNLSPLPDKKYKLFLLPDSMTAEKQYDFAADNGFVSRGLGIFLNKEMKTSVTLMKVIKQGETYALRLGFLFNTPGGLTRAELFSKGHQQHLPIPDKEIKLPDITGNGIGLVLGLTLNSGTPDMCYSITSCGRLSFSN